MKLKHTIKRDGCTLSGRILETIFEGNEKRGDRKYIRVNDIYLIVSVARPYLTYWKVYVHWEDSDYDSEPVSCTYDCEQGAQAMLDAINSITIVDKPIQTEEKWVYVSHISEEDALRNPDKRLLLADLWDKYIDRYITPAGLISWTSWRYAVPAPSPKKLRQVEMTDEEYEKFTNPSTFANK